MKPNLNETRKTKLQPRTSLTHLASTNKKKKHPSKTRKEERGENIDHTKEEGKQGGEASLSIEWMAWSSKGYCRRLGGEERALEVGSTESNKSRRTEGKRGFKRRGKTVLVQGHRRAQRCCICGQTTWAITSYHPPITTWHVAAQGHWHLGHSGLVPMAKTLIQPSPGVRVLCWHHCVQLLY